MEKQPVERKTCNTCDVELDISRYASYFSKGRNMVVVENRCRTCKNEVGRLLMAVKAAKKKEEREKQKAEENVVSEEDEIEETPKLTEKQIEKQAADKARRREYYLKNKDASLARSKVYKAENKDKINETRRKYLKKKMKDPLERLKRSMKTLLLAKIKKHHSSTTYFGTNVDFILKWLEFNFDEEMSWDNYGTCWQIDHTIPVNSWDVSKHDEAMMCFNWKNLMPLNASMNLRKATHLQPIRVFYQEQRLRKFHKEQELTEPIDEYLSSYGKKLKSLLPEFYMRHTSIAGISSKS